MRQIESLSTAIIPKPSKSTLTMPRAAQSSLSHCTTTRPGIVAGSSGTTESRAPSEITMPPECWLRWRGKSCSAMQSSRYFGNSFLREIKPCAFEVGFKIVVRPAPLPAFDQRRQPVERRHIESEHLADFLCRGTPAIGTDIRGHRRAAFAVAQIHVLNCFFPLVAARKIQVNIRPFPALFRQKALEQQIHTDRIDGRNAQRIAHRAVCRRPPALHQNPAFEAVADDVPDDEKITGQLQLLDQRQL